MHVLTYVQYLRLFVTHPVFSHEALFCGAKELRIWFTTKTCRGKEFGALEYSCNVYCHTLVSPIVCFAPFLVCRFADTPEPWDYGRVELLQSML